MGETAPLPEPEHEHDGHQRVPGNDFNAEHGFINAWNTNRVKN
jgi:hypothetical protein